MRCLLTLTILCVSAAICGAADPVEIVLAETATAAGTVRVRDVGTVRGGTPEVRDRITALDLTDMPRTGKSADVTRRLVEIRLRLAGWDDVRVTGADAVAVSPPAAKAAPAAPVPAASGPPLIRTKQRVTMTVRTNGLVLSAIGEAQEPGRLGQAIKLKNIDSQKVVSGTVSGPATVDVELGGGS